MLTIYVLTVTLIWAGNADQPLDVMSEIYPTMKACVDDNRSTIENTKGPRPDYVRSIKCTERKISLRFIKP